MFVVQPMEHCLVLANELLSLKKLISLKVKLFLTSAICYTSRSYMGLLIVNKFVCFREIFLREENLNFMY